MDKWKMTWRLDDVVAYELGFPKIRGHFFGSHQD